MENNEKVVSTTETVQKPAETKEQVQEETKEIVKTYTRAEVEAIKKAEREALMKEIELSKTEAEKMAKMDAETKSKYELDKVAKERDEALSKLNAYELKEEAIKMAKEKGVNISLLEVIDFTKETADSVINKIDILKDNYTKSVQDGINESLKEKTPKTVVNTDNSGAKKSIPNVF